MAAGDWIGFVAAIVAAVSCVVAVVAFRLQGRTQAAGDEERLSDLIEKMQKGLEKLGKVRQEATLDSYAASSVTLTSLRGQALEARKLIKRANIEPDWFQNMIVAITFSQTWDLASAEPYWNGAIDASSDKDGHVDHPAHIASLTARAEFYYNRGLGDDWNQARKGFQAAYDELKEDPDQQGPDLVNEQLALMSLRQAAFELDAVGESGAIPYIVEAFVRANSIAAGWRKRNALKTLGNLIADVQRMSNHPDLLTKVRAELAPHGVHLDEVSPDVSAVLSMPPDGSLFANRLTGDDSAAS
jgi:hypothetical protein